MYCKALLLAWLSKPGEGEVLSGPLVLVTQYEPTSQMWRAPRWTLVLSCDAKLATSVKLHPSKDETRESKEHDSSRTLFGFRFPVLLRNDSIIRFQKGLDSAPGNDSRQASLPNPAIVFLISFWIPNLPKSHASTEPPFKLGRPLFIRQYKGQPKL